MNEETYIKPQERNIEGFIEFIKDGKPVKEKKVYSIPCERCNGCPVYRIDNRVIPTAYYCQAEFLIGNFINAIENNLIPSDCRIPSVCNTKNIRRNKP